MAWFIIVMTMQAVSKRRNTLYVVVLRPNFKTSTKTYLLSVTPKKNLVRVCICYNDSDNLSWESVSGAIDRRYSSTKPGCECIDHDQPKSWVSVAISRKKRKSM